MSVMLACCGSADTQNRQNSAFDDHRTGSMELLYADQFHVDFYDDGIAVIEVEDGLKYLATEDPEELDSAHVGNVGEHTETLTAYQETSDVSPRGNSNEAVRFVKSGDKSTTVVISLWRSYKVVTIVTKDLQKKVKLVTAPEKRINRPPTILYIHTYLYIYI